MIFQPKRGFTAGMIAALSWTLGISTIHYMKFADPLNWVRLCQSSVLILISFAVIGTFTNWLRDMDYIE
jgi:hypothetical protein